MKFIILVIAMVCSASVYAADCSKTSDATTVEETKEIKTDVPRHLVGATICVKQADGKESCVPAEKFKVVPRIQQFVITKTKQTDKLICGPDKNRVSLLAGNGPKEGLDRRNEGNKVIVESRTGAVGGLQYQRLITNDISLGAQVQSNESVLINIGLDF